MWLSMNGKLLNNFGFSGFCVRNPANSLVCSYDKDPRAAIPQPNTRNISRKAATAAKNKVISTPRSWRPFDPVQGGLGGSNPSFLRGH